MSPTRAAPWGRKTRKRNGARSLEPRLVLRKPEASAAEQCLDPAPADRVRHRGVAVDLATDLAAREVASVDVDVEASANQRGDQRRCERLRGNAGAPYHRTVARRDAR